MNNKLKYQAGDIWEMLVDDHRELKRGDYFEVDEVCAFGAAYTSGGIRVSDTRLKDGEVRIIERNGEPVQNTFTKDMLESGKHVVEHRDGTKCLVINNKLAGLYKGELLSNFTIGLLHHTDSLHDVVRVYKANDSLGTYGMIHEDNELVWERQELSVEKLELQKLEEQMCEIADKIAALRGVVDNPEWFKDEE